MPSVPCEVALDRLFPFGGSKKHRPHPALISDPTVTSHQVKSLGHRRIGGSNGIIHFINERREFERHLEHTGLTDFNSFVEGLMLTNEYTILDVLIDLPSVRRVNFLDVDGEEVDPIAIGAVDAIEGPSLGPKGRSGVAPEHQRHRTIPKTIREPNRFALVCAVAW